MIVFRNCRKSTFTDECLDRISALIHSMPCSNMPHDKVVSLLIETGDLETSVADSLFS